MIYLLLATLFYTLVILAVTAASRHINSNLVVMISNLMAVVIPLVLVITALDKKPVGNQKFGVMMAATAGVCIGLFTLCVTRAYSVNKVGVVAPVVFGGAILLSTIAGYFIFKEKVSTLQLAGLLMLALGFATIIFARATGR